jgi:hypothetical protein
MRRDCKSQRHRSVKETGVAAWMEAERETLRTYHNKVSFFELAHMLGGRHSISAIKSEARRMLGVRPCR